MAEEYITELSVVLAVSISYTVVHIPLSIYIPPPPHPVYLLQTPVRDYMLAQFTNQPSAGLRGQHELEKTKMSV